MHAKVDFSKSWNVQEIKDWYKQESGTEIPAGWDNTVKDCLDFIAHDCYYSGYNDGKKMCNAEKNNEK